MTGQFYSASAGTATIVSLRSEEARGPATPFEGRGLLHTGYEKEVSLLAARDKDADPAPAVKGGPRPSLRDACAPLTVHDRAREVHLWRQADERGQLLPARLYRPGQGHWEHQGRAGRVIDGLRVRLHMWPPLRLTRLRYERECVDVVLPAHVPALWR